MISARQLTAFLLIGIDLSDGGLLIGLDISAFQIITWAVCLVEGPDIVGCPVAGLLINCGKILHSPILIGLRLR